MAVTKLWKVSVRLGQVLDYTTNPEKTANPEYSLEDYQALKDVIEELTRRVTKTGFKGKRLTLKVRFPDFTTVTRSGVSAQLLDCAESIDPLARRLLNNVTLPVTGIRLLGLSISRTEKEIREDYLAEQMRLFD